MEQPNMMANGMPPPNMNQMQRPQSGNIGQQLHAKVMEDLSKQPPTGMGWQVTMDARERAAQIIQLITQLRILNSNVHACIQTAENFENKTIITSGNKDMYLNAMKHKMQEVMQRRAQQAQAQQQAMANGGMGMMNDNAMGGNMNNMGGNMGGMMGMPQNGMNGFGNMQMNGMGGMNMQNQGMGMPPNQMNINGGQQGQGFPAHLQRPMQPTPLPQQQSNNTMDPSAMHAPQQMQQRMPPNMNVPQMQNGNTQSQQQQGQGQGQGPDPEVMAQARQMMNNIDEARKNQLRHEFLSKMSEQQRAAIRGKDPLMQIIVKQAANTVQKRRAHQQQQQQQNGAQQGQNPGQGGNNANNRNSMQQQQNGNQDFSNFQGQQANAIKSQQSGEQVVPASNNQNNMNGGQQQQQQQQQQNNMSQGINPQMLGNQNGQVGGGQQQQQPNQNQNQQQPVNQQMQMEMLMRARQQQLEKQQQERSKQNHAAQQHAQALQLAHQQRQQQQQQNRPNQLTGQPGGLNAPNANMGGPNAQVNSPAQMPMLNRPMGPPGQQNPSTPQQNRGQGMPPTPSSNPTQLQAHFQQMMNTHNNGQPMPQGVPGPIPQGEAQKLLSTIPTQFREQLASFTPDQVQTLLHQMQARQRQGMAAQQHGGMPGQGMPMNMQPDMNNAMPQPGAQMNAMPQVQQNMGNVIPDFNSQPPANQQMGNQSQAQNQNQTQQAQMQERLRQQHQIMIRQKAMDSRPFPKKMLSSLGISAPQNVQTWGDLKAYVLQNQGQMPSQTLDKLSQGQGQWFSHNKEELQTALHAAMAQHKSQQQRMNQPQAPPNFGPPGTAMPGGPAPTAPMGAPMQAPPNQGQGGMPMPPRVPNLNISDQELAAFRQKFPQYGGQTDEQVRNFIMENKRRQFQQHQNQQQLLQQQNAIRNAQRQQNNNGGQPPMMNGNQQTPGQRPPSQQPPNMQMPGQKRPQASNDDLMEIPNPNAQRPTPQQAAPMQSNRSMGAFPMPTQEQLAAMPEDKRNELLNRMANLRRAGGRPTASTSQPGQQAMPPQQQQQQLGRPPIHVTQAAKAKVDAFMRQIEKETPKGPPVQIDAAAMQQVRPLLAKMYEPCQKIASTYTYALNTPDNVISDERLKSVMRGALIFRQNVADKQGNLNGHLSITLDQIVQHQNNINSYFNSITKYRNAVAAGNANATAKPPTPAQAPAQTPAAAPKQTDQKKTAGETGKKGPQANKKNASNKAPPAPTDGNKTFEWPERSISSPHGVPNYHQRNNELTPDKLKMPPGKRAKHNNNSGSNNAEATATNSSHAPTPASQAGTPGLLAQSPLTNNSLKAGNSPEVLRKIPQQLKAEAEEQQLQKQKHKCRDPLCQAAISGFETESELQKHVDLEHQPLASDPLQFLLESASLALGVDAEGKLKPPAAPATRVLPQGRAKTTATTVGALQKGLVVKREGLTPGGIKQEALTPAAAAAFSASPATPAASTISKLAGKTSVTPSAGRGKVAAAATAPSTTAAQAAAAAAAAAEQSAQRQPQSLKDAMAVGLGFVLADHADNETATTAATTVADTATAADDNALWTSLLTSTFDFGGDMPEAGPGNMPLNSFSTGTPDFLDPVAWGLRPADLDPMVGGTDMLADFSPESTASSLGTSNSDVSENDRLVMALQWDPFGMGDEAVPEGLLGMGGFGLGDGVGDVDVEMGEASAGGEGGKGAGDGGEGMGVWPQGAMDWEMVFGTQ